MNGAGSDASAHPPDTYASALGHALEFLRDLTAAGVRDVVLDLPGDRLPDGQHWSFVFRPLSAGWTWHCQITPHD